LGLFRIACCVRRSGAMRILYFSRDYTPHDHRFLAAMAENGHEVYYLRLERRGHQQEDRLLPAGIKPVKWAGGQRVYRLRELPRLAIDLRRVLREVEPDLVHAGPIHTAGLLAALSGFHPLVSMSWGSDLLLDADKNRWNRRATGKTLRHSDVMVGDCEVVKRKAMAFGFPEERIVTFPWGVDLAQFSPGEDSGLRARAGWEDAFVLLHTRSWEPLYGVDAFAKAFAMAARERPELRLFLLGNGSLAGEVRQTFMGGGVMERVHFSGQVKYADLPKYYRAADLYVSASHCDGSSVSLMEALACGKPALVSDIAGNREWVRPGEQGWLFPDGDVGALAEGIVRAVEQRETLAEIGRKSRKLAEERANWKENVKSLFAAYEKAIERK
jgi:glycosyltransferase involved in cell wall biosynthesis